MPEEDETKIELLVIDDEPIVCRNLKLALSKSGYSVEAYEDPMSALKRFSEKRFDIVVTDVVMGDVDGIQVLDHVMERSPQTKVIIMTAFAYMNLARRAMERGAFDFIAKPFNTEEIRAIVDKAAKALVA